MTKKRGEAPEWLERMRAENNELDSLTHALSQAMAERDRALMQRDSWQMRAAAAEQERDEARAYALVLEAELFPKLDLHPSDDVKPLGDTH